MRPSEADKEEECEGQQHGGCNKRKLPLLLFKVYRFGFCANAGHGAKLRNFVSVA
jgi:hypothetical protein